MEADGDLPGLRLTREALKGAPIDHLLDDRDRLEGLLPADILLRYKATYS